jgi:hypothetical protein
MEHGITFACGAEIPPGEANLATVRNGLLTASAGAIDRIFPAGTWSSRLPRAGNPAALALRAADEPARRRIWVNGHQVGSINALQRREPFNVLEHDPLLTELLGLFAAFPELCHADLRIRGFFDGDESATWVGGDVCRKAIQTSQVTGRIAFYDFGPRCLKPVERAGLEHFPCLAVEGMVVAMSMPHPPESADSFEPQHGHKPRSWGKLLPGWHLIPGADGTLRAHGPAAPEDGLPLPAGSSLDEEGFLISR